MKLSDEELRKLGLRRKKWHEYTVAQAGITFVLLFVLVFLTLLLFGK